MKKKQNKLLNFFGKIFKFLYKILDTIIITPISKLIYLIIDGLSGKGRFDKFLNNSNTLVYLSLFFACIIFYGVDRKVINLSDTGALVLSNNKNELR